MSTAPKPADVFADAYRASLASDLASLREPSGWTLIPLGRLFEFRNGVNADKTAYGHGIPFVNVLETITRSHIKAADIPGRVSLPKTSADSFQIRHGDVLFNRTSETQEEAGLAAVYLDNEVATFGGFVIRARPISRALDATYSGYALRGAYVRSQIIARAQGAIHANVAQADLKKVSVLAPSLDEQGDIARSLADTDALIGKLGKLIVKKRAIKTAAMQQLLTARIRLPEFSREWRNTVLGDLVVGFSSGSTPSRANKHFYRGNIPWVTSGELNYNEIADSNEKITNAAVKAANLRIIPAGTFLMAITGLEAEGTRGACAILGISATTNQSCMAIFPSKELVSEYLFHWYTYRGKTLALSYCQGTKQQSYTASLIKKLPIHLPTDVEEQRAITLVLSEMDLGIAALERRLEKTRAIKLGMMQALLTGRVRLVRPRPEPAAATV